MRHGAAPCVMAGTSTIDARRPFGRAAHAAGCIARGTHEGAGRISQPCVGLARNGELPQEDPWGSVELDVAHIIVVGNEKGGAGKSTVAMHVASALARQGHPTGCLDLDLRQKSLARYLDNRRRYLAQEGLDLPTPAYVELPDIDRAMVPEGENINDHRLSMAVAALEPEADFIVIDCPGSHTRLSQVAHSLADTLVTPLNDSFVDFDLLARVDVDGETILGPSVYSEMVWSARQLRAKAGLPPIDWIVARNRLGAQAMVNKQKMETAIARLSRRIGFRMAPGFNERVIFRELFPRGLTLLDLRDVGVTALNISNVAARQELRDLMRALNLPGVQIAF
jgi:chromosome partitioning protein